jgi:hypothetical protein
MSTHRLKARSQLVFAGVACSTGLALLLALIFKVSLALVLLLLAVFSSIVLFVQWGQSAPSQRELIKRRFAVGAAAGALATLGYDTARFLVVKAFHFHIAPFEAIPLFGYLMVGQRSSLWTAIFAGTAYHYLNGTAFATAYCLLFAERDWKWGVVWALGLEAAMFTVYPGWLDLKTVMKEFTVVSLSGHVIYGTILGVLAQRWITGIPRPQSIH